MAKRYSGNLQISVIYDDKGHYRTSVSSGGKSLWRGVVNPAPAGFGPGIAYDSPKAYDEIASSALTFADHEVGGIGDEAEFDEQLTGYLIRRSPRSKIARHHATRKTSPAQLDREIADVLAKDYRVLVRVEGAPKPVHVSPWMSHAQAEHAAKNHKAMIRDRGWTQVVEIEDKNGAVTRLPR